MAGLLHLSRSRRWVLTRGAAAAGAAGAVTIFGSPMTSANSLMSALLQQKGGKLSVGTVGDFLNLDPFIMNAVNYPLMETVYDQLVRLDGEIKAHPYLLESWEYSDDDLTMTLKLRQGVKFHSGREMTADDIVKNFERAAVKETGGNVYSLLPIFDSVTATDPQTVELKLPTVSPYLESMLGIVSIIDPEGFDTLKSKDGGSGPFVVKEWIPGDHATLVRNEDYWDQERPYVDEVTYHFYDDPASMVSAIEGGLIDIANGVPNSEIERLQSDYTISHGQNGARFYFLGLNTKDKPFDNKQVRQAIGYAMDRATMVSNALFNVGEPIVSPFPSYSPAYSADDNKLYPYDLDKAKQMLADAGFPDGIEFTISVTNAVPEYLSFAQILQADLETIGSKVTIQPMDNTQWTSMLYDGSYQSTFSAASGVQMYPTRIAGSSMFSEKTNTVWPDGKAPEAYVEGMREADTTLDPEKQKAGLKKMVDSFLDEAWAHVISFKLTNYATKKQVSGLDHGPYDSIRLDKVTKG
jgi:peptide/nickel transport system substrate-binding protein